MGSRIRPLEALPTSAVVSRFDTSHRDARAAAAATRNLKYSEKEYPLQWLVSPREAAYIRGEDFEKKEDKWQRFHRRQLKPFVDKWKIMLRILPLTVFFVAVRAIVNVSLPSFVGYFDVTQVGFIFTGSIFVIGLVFTGVIADFKEAEKAPALLSATIEGLDDAASVLHANRSLDSQADAFRENTLLMVDTLLLWLETDAASTYYEIQDKISTMNSSLSLLERTSGAPLISRLMGEINSVRVTLARMRSIRETNYLPAARALMQVLLLVNVGVSIIASYSNLVLCYVSVAFVSLLFTFLNVLAHDLDDPLEPPSKRITICDGAATIDMRSLLYARERLAARVQLRKRKSDAPDSGADLPVPEPPCSRNGQPTSSSSSSDANSTAVNVLPPGLSSGTASLR